MALKDYYNLNDVTDFTFSNSNWWVAQTFTAGSNYTIGSVKLKIGAQGYSPGIVTVSIRNTTGSAPDLVPVTGTDLCVGTINADELSMGWHEITFSTPYALTVGTVYAIVVRCQSTGLTWRCEVTGTNYADGRQCWAGSGDTGWQSWETQDCMFETYDSVSNLVELTGGLTNPIDELSGILSTVGIISLTGGLVNPVDALNGILSFADVVSLTGVLGNELDALSGILLLAYTPTSPPSIADFPSARGTSLADSDTLHNLTLVAVGYDSDGLGTIYFEET